MKIEKNSDENFLFNNNNFLNNNHNNNKNNQIQKKIIFSNDFNLKKTYKFSNKIYLNKKTKFNEINFNKINNKINDQKLKIFFEKYYKLIFSFKKNKLLFIFNYFNKLNLHSLIFEEFSNENNIHLYNKIINCFLLLILLSIKISEKIFENNNIIVIKKYIKQFYKKIYDYYTFYNSNEINEDFINNDLNFFLNKIFNKILFNNNNNENNNKNKDLINIFIYYFKNIDILSIHKINNFYKNHFNNNNNDNINNNNKKKRYFIPLNFLNNLNYNIENLIPPFLNYNTNKPITLIFDLDETLIHFSLYNDINNNDNNNEKIGEIFFRPFLFKILKKLKKNFEIVLFTAGLKEYADTVINIIESKIGKIFDCKFYRENMSVNDNKIFKNISNIGRDLKKIIIIDNNNENFGNNFNNGIKIKDYFGNNIFNIENNNKDNKLKLLYLLLKKIYKDYNNNNNNNNFDVRESLKKYNYLIKKIEN